MNTVYVVHNLSLIRASTNHIFEYLRTQNLEVLKSSVFPTTGLPSSVCVVFCAPVMEDLWLAKDVFSNWITIRLTQSRKSNHTNKGL